MLRRQSIIGLLTAGYGIEPVHIRIIGQTIELTGRQPGLPFQPMSSGNYTRTEKLLLEAARIFNSTLEYEELMAAVLRLVNTAVNCEGALVFRIDHEREDIKIRFMGRNDEEMRVFSHEPGAGVLSWSAEFKEAVIVNDPDNDPRVDNKIEEMSGLKIRSLLTVPLIGRGHMIGVVEAVNKLDGQFDEQDLDSLTGLNNQMAVAIDNAHLYRELRREAHEKDMLYEVGKKLSGRLSLNETMEEIIASLKQVTVFVAGGVFLIDDDNMDLSSIYAEGYDEDDNKIRLKFGEGLVGHVAGTGEAIIVPDVSQDDRYVSANARTKSEIVVPIRSSDKLIGVLTVESDIIGAFDQKSLNLFSAFAAQAAISIERAQMHEQLLERNTLNEQLRIARDIQRDFLPHEDPVISGYEACGTNISLGQVGGDYYDFIKIVEGQTGIAIADVSGKGVPAALIMAAFRASLIAEIRNNFAIKDIMTKVNLLLCESTEPGNYVTAFHSVLDSKNHILTYCNAGHNPPYLLRATGEVELLDEGGPVVGVTDLVPFNQKAVNLYSGDLIVMFTDGVTEVFDDAGEQYGEARLLELIKKHRDLSAIDLQNKIKNTVIEYASDHHLFDDLTLVIVKRL